MADAAIVAAPVLAASAATETAGAATMAGADGAAAPLTCTVMPPSLDAAGIALAEALNMRGALTQAIMAQLIATRGMYATTIAVNGISYTATDVVAQTALSL